MGVVKLTPLPSLPRDVLLSFVPVRDPADGWQCNYMLGDAASKLSFDKSKTILMFNTSLFFICPLFAVVCQHLTRLSRTLYTVALPGLKLVLAARLRCGRRRF